MALQRACRSGLASDLCRDAAYSVCADAVRRLMRKYEYWARCRSTAADGPDSHCAGNAKGAAQYETPQKPNTGLDALNVSGNGSTGRSLLPHMNTGKIRGLCSRGVPCENPTALILNPVSKSCPSGSWAKDDYDVFGGSLANAFLTSDLETPNCRAIRDGVIPALKAARTAFNFPSVR
jgi:hypothetical protein